MRSRDTVVRLSKDRTWWTHRGRIHSSALGKGCSTELGCTTTSSARLSGRELRRTRTANASGGRRDCERHVVCHVARDIEQIRRQLSCSPSAMSTKNILFGLLGSICKWANSSYVRGNLVGVVRETNEGSAVWRWFRKSSPRLRRRACARSWRRMPVWVRSSLTFCTSRRESTSATCGP